VLGLATGTWTHKTHHGPDSGVSHHLTPYSILCISPRRLHPNGTFCWDSRNGVPKLSRVRVSGLWTATAPRPNLGSGRVLNQSCSSCWELSNAVSHFSRKRREEVDSRLLMVGSQIANLTPSSSFAHNLSYICPNGQCEAIFDIYVSRPFQWHQEHLNARCLGLAVELWTFGSPEGLQTSNFSKCWASPPHLAKVGLRH
jgi:hypothetical protein